MNNLLKLYILLLFNNIFLQIKIDLSTKGDIFGLDILLGANNEKYFLILDTSIPKSLIASPNCTKCNNDKYDPTLDNSNKLIEENAKLTKKSNNYYGDEYKGLYSFTKDKYTKYDFDYLSITDIDLISKMNVAGYFSLFSQFFYNSTNSINFIALELDYEDGTLNINSVDSYYNYSKATNYTINIDNNTKEWYLAPISLTTKGEKYNIENQYFLKFDTTSWSFKIPKKFFFDNLEIFEDYGCSVTYYNTFICDCVDGSYNAFPTFSFTFKDNSTFEVVPTDYLTLYDDATSCEVYIEVNYENDFFIGGLNVLNNFYSVFDFQNKVLSVIDLERSFYYASPSFVLKFLLIFFLSGLSFYLIYSICTKCYYRVRAREMDRGNNEAEAEIE